MDYERQLKLQSFLDGELSEGEKREVANWLAQDKEATALLGELRNTRSAMVGFEIGLELPESREFFWSKVSRQIEALEPEPAVSSSPSWLRFLRRVLVPTAAIAALVLAAFLVTTQSPPRYSGAETALDDSGAFTYHDYDEGATLVWFSYPAEDDKSASDTSSFE